MQYIELDGFGNVKGFIEMDGVPERAGMTYEVQDPPVTTYPAAPFPSAILRWADGATYWHDPRSADEKSVDARAHRDALLLACDWVITRAFELGQAVPATWSAYRQSLRDLPQQPGFPAAIDWPTSPTD